MSTSILFYGLVTIIATLLAFLSEEFGDNFNKGELNNFFYNLLIIWLVFIMGFRSVGVGVDDYSYLRTFNNISNSSFTEFYGTYHTEPLYYFLNKIISLFTKDFQWVLIVSSIITIFGVLDLLKYYSRLINFPLAVFIFVLTQYFYYFGIIRLGIAVGIISLAIKYIDLGNKKRYFWFVILASLFHYSALIAMLLLLYNKQYKHKIRQLFFVIPVGFLMVRIFLYPLIGDGKYSGYVESSELSLNISGVINLLPLIIIAIVYGKLLKDKSEKYELVLYLFLIRIFIEIFSPLMGIARTFWYFNISQVLIFSSVEKISKFKENKITIVLIAVIISIVYSNAAYFGDSHRANYLLPYRNVFFEILDETK